jgi:hypothetical protein
VHDKLAEQYAKSHIGVDQAAAVEMERRRLVAVALDLADHLLDRVLQQ